jgi:hypothetical protein
MKKERDRSALHANSTVFLSLAAAFCLFNVTKSVSVAFSGFFVVMVVAMLYGWKIGIFTPK